MDKNITINQLDPNTFEYQTYTSADESLIASSDLDTVFTSLTDYIEYYIYDQNKTLIYPFETLPLVRYDIREGDVLLSPISNIQDSGFDVGSYNILYSFYRKRLASSVVDKYFISEISSDRTEIRLDSNTISNDLIISSSNDFIDYRETANYFVDFYLNFGDNQTVIANNIKLETDEDLDPTILIKLYEPLPSNFTIKNELWVVELLSQPQAYEVNFPFEPVIEQDFTYIQGPNYSLDIVNQTATSEEQFSYSTLIESNLTSSINQIRSLLNEKEINININYEDYSNFINFSSAKTRLENFYYKVGLIESYNNQLITLSTQVTSTTSTTVPFSSSKAQLTGKIDKIIKNFDGYEYFLYFNSGSQYSYPKQTSSPPYQLYSTGSVEALEWIGNTSISSPYYGGQALSASNYDQDNRDWLYWAIPEYLREDSANKNYELFVDMVGQYYDNVWVYTKDLTNKFNGDNRLDYGISKDLVADAIRDFAVKLYSNNFNTDDLFTAFLGLTPSGSAFPFPNITGSLPTPTGYEYVDTKISASNDIVPQDDVNKSLYKRIYHNIPYLLKTKGTIAGIRALITSYGIPDTILRISEFGGKDRNEAQDYDLKQNVFNYAFDTGIDGSNENYLESNFIPNNTWDGISDTDSPRTIQFRFKSAPIPTGSNNLPSSNIRYSQSLWSTNDGGNIVLEYTGSGFVTGSYSGSISSPYDTYGTLKWIPANDDNPNISSSIYLPFFNNDWWSVQVNINTTTGNSTLFTANQINGKIGFSGSDVANGFDPSYYKDATIARLNYSTDIILNGVTYGVFSGSFQELRYWTQQISESKFFDYTVNPYSNEGNTINSTPNELMFRAALGTQLDTGSRTSIHPRITGSDVQITQSFENGTSTFTISDADGKIFVTNKEFIYQDQVPSGIKNRITDKIHKENLILAEAPYGISGSTAVISSTNNDTTTISQIESIQQESFISQSYTPNINYLEVGFSPSNQINDDINAQIGYFNIGEYIGDPRFISSSDYSYPDLNRLRDAYFEKYMASYDIVDFIRLIKFFDNSLFKMVKDFTPARTSLASGVIIKQHLLERNRQRPALATSSFHDYSGSIKPFPKDYNTGSADQPQYSTSGSAIYKFTGGPGGVMNRYNGLRTSPSASAYGLTNQFGPLTQSYDETLFGPLGQEIVTIFNQDEFYNGEFSGSDVMVTNGELNPECDVYKDPSIDSISFFPIFFNNITTTAIRGISTLNSFNNIENVPLPGFAWFYSEGTGVGSISAMKYIKLASKDINGNSIGEYIESTSTLDVLFNDAILPGGRSATSYVINNSINNGSHVLIEISDTQGDYNITGSSQGGSEQFMLEISGSYTSSYDQGLGGDADLYAQNNFHNSSSQFQTQYIYFWGQQDGTVSIPKQPTNLEFFNPGSVTNLPINNYNNSGFISGSYTLGRTPNVPLFFSASLFYSSSDLGVASTINVVNQVVHSGSFYGSGAPNQTFRLTASNPSQGDSDSGSYYPSPISISVDTNFFTNFATTPAVLNTLRGNQGSGTNSAGSSQIIQEGTASIDFHFPELTILQQPNQLSPGKLFITYFSGSNFNGGGLTFQDFGGDESTISGTGYDDAAKWGKVVWDWEDYEPSTTPAQSAFNTLNYLQGTFSFEVKFPGSIPNNSWTFSEIGIQFYSDDGQGPGAGPGTIKEATTGNTVSDIQYTNTLGNFGQSIPTNVEITPTNINGQGITVSGTFTWGDLFSFGNANGTYPYDVAPEMYIIPYFKTAEDPAFPLEYYIEDFSVNIQQVALTNGQNQYTTITPYTIPYQYTIGASYISNTSINLNTQPLRNGTQGDSTTTNTGLVGFSNSSTLSGNTVTASAHLMYTSSTRNDIITSSQDLPYTFNFSFNGTDFKSETFTFPDSPILDINDPTIPDFTDATSGSTVNEEDGMYYIEWELKNWKVGASPLPTSVNPFNDIDFISGDPTQPSPNSKIIVSQEVQNASGGSPELTASLFIQKGNSSNIPSTVTEFQALPKFFIAEDFLETSDNTSTGRININGTLPEFVNNTVSTVLGVNDVLRFGIDVEKDFGFGMKITEYSMSIFPSSSRWASYAGVPSYTNFDEPEETGIIVPSFYGEGVLPFNFALDCQPLLNNYNLQRPSTFLMDVDYSSQSGPIIPVNQLQILSGSAVKAAVPDSNYSQLKSILPRYVGSKSTSQQLNEWSIGDVGTFGKLPTIELKDAFFGYFNDIDDPYPNINGLTRVNLNYLIDEQGNALPPSLNQLSITTFESVFPTSTLGKLAAKSGKNQYKSLGDPAPIKSIMEYVTPVMYSQISGHNYTTVIPLSGSGYISQYDNGDENDVLICQFNALGTASVDTSQPTQTVDYYLDPSEQITQPNPPNDFDPYVAVSANNIDRIASYPASTSVIPNVVTNTDLPSSQIVTIQTSFVTSFVSETNRTRDELAFELHMYTRGSTSSGGVYTGTLEKGFNLEDIQCKVYTDDGRVTSLGSVLEYGWFEMTNIVNYYTVRRRGTFRSFFRRWRFRRWIYSKVPVPTGGIRCTVDWEMYETLFDRGLMRERGSKGSAGVQALEWIINANSGKHTIQGDDKISWRIIGSFKNSRGGFRQGFFFPDGYGGSYTPTNIQGQGANDWLAGEANTATAPFWVYGTQNNDAQYDTSSPQKLNVLIMSSSNMNEAYGTTFRQADLEYQPGNSEYFEGGVEPAYTTFDPIISTIELKENDEIRFANNENFTYRVINVFSPQENVAGTPKKGRIKVILDRDVDRSINKDFFLVRRPIVNPNALFLDMEFPYETLTSASFTTVFRNTASFLLPISGSNVNPSSSLAFTGSSTVGPVDSQGFYTASMFNVETATTPGILYPDYPTQYLVESASIIVNDLISKGIIES